MKKVLSNQPMSSEEENVWFGMKRGQSRVSSWNAKLLLACWYELYTKSSFWHREIEFDVDTGSCGMDYLTTAPDMYSELLTLICDKYIADGCTKIKVHSSKRWREVHLTLSATTNSTKILSCAGSLDEYLASVDEADGRMTDAFCAAAGARAGMSYTIASDGTETVELVFNRIDVGVLGLKAHTNFYRFIIGIDRARSKHPETE